MFAVRSNYLSCRIGGKLPVYFTRRNTPHAGGRDGGGMRCDLGISTSVIRTFIKGRRFDAASLHVWNKSMIRFGKSRAIEPPTTDKSGPYLPHMRTNTGILKAGKCIWSWSRVLGVSLFVREDYAFLVQFSAIFARYKVVSRRWTEHARMRRRHSLARRACNGAPSVREFRIPRG